MSGARSLYEDDFVRWSEEQAAAIRAAARSRASLPLDWENIAEEIESLGKSDRRELRSRLRTLIEHLLKLECSPAQSPRAGWKSTIQRTRAAIGDLLADSPSLKSSLADEIAAVRMDAAKSATWDLESRGETRGAHLRARDGDYTTEQILTDWWPDGVDP